MLRFHAHTFISITVHQPQRRGYHTGWTISGNVSTRGRVRFVHFDLQYLGGKNIISKLGYLNARIIHILNLYAQIEILPNICGGRSFMSDAVSGKLIPTPPTAPSSEEDEVRFDPSRPEEVLGITGDNGAQEAPTR